MPFPQLPPQARNRVAEPNSSVAHAFSTSPNPTQEGIHHLKLTTKREELVSKLSIVSRAVSTRAATQSLSGVLLTAADGRRRSRATDLDMGLETTPRRRGRRRGLGAAARPACSPRSPARSADPTVEIESREAERDVEIRSGGSSFHLRVLPAEDFPKLPERGGRAAEDPGRGARREHRPGRPRRLARRHAPGADRRPRHRQRLGDDDGRHRLLPAGGEADRAGERARRRARGEHPGPGAARAGPHPLRRGRRGGLGLAAAPTRPFSRQGRSSSPRG